MTDRLEELLAKVTLFDILAVFVSFATDQTSRMILNEPVLMDLLKESWGNNGEKAPTELQGPLKNTWFSEGYIVWSKRVEESLSILKMGSILSWICNTKYCWVELSNAESRRSKFSEETLSYLEDLAKHYRSRLGY